MNLTTSRVRSYASKLATLLGSASVAALAGALGGQDRAQAGEAVAQAQPFPEAIPESVLITGSLIRGTVAVGVPVTNLSPMDFAQIGALTVADLFRAIPQADIRSGEVGQAHGGLIERGNKVNIRRLDSPDAIRSLLMVDGIRVSPQGNGSDLLDPSIIPAISLDHIDILVDGASATYGSDAIGGVVNIILRRNFDGAMTQLRFTDRTGGGARYQVSQLWGRTWDGGQITMSYEWYETVPAKANVLSNFGVDHSPWGYDDRRPVGSSSPATLSTGGLGGAAARGTACGYNTGAATPTPSRCYSVPQGTGADFPVGSVGPLDPYSASTLDWTELKNDPDFAGPLNPSAGTRNMFNPYSITWYDTAEQRNGGALTVDQRLTRDISFAGSGFYSNRRAQYLSPGGISPSANNHLTAIAVPTWNPYYPTGGAPGSLRVSYDLGTEALAKVSAYEVDGRYSMGLNVALPRQWGARVYYALSYHSSAHVVHNSANPSAVSAALGWTIAPVSASGSAPSFGTWTKPANVPYLNLFCDPMQFKCNSDTTLNYLAGYRDIRTVYQLNTKGITADGPLFDLPGGQVKAAIGVDLTSYHNSGLVQNNTLAPNLMIDPGHDANGRFVWATFAQVNIPVFSEMNALPFLRRLELEASWRHDQYSDVGGTSNPKISFNWAPIDDLLLRGTWGSNFRAPTFGEISPGANVAIAGYNLGDLGNTGNVLNTCQAAGAALPDALSGAGKLQHAARAFADAMGLGGAGCVASLPAIALTGPYSQPAATLNGAKPLAAVNAIGAIDDLLQPGGITTLGSSPQVGTVRKYAGGSVLLQPEKATNWGVGFQYTPTTNILRGLDIQATYYIVKINGVLRGYGQPSDGVFIDSLRTAQYPSPSDMGCPDIPGALNATRPGVSIPANLAPSLCAQWMEAVNSLVSNPRTQVNPLARTAVYWIADGAVQNLGWERIDGIDWQLSYDWDMGNLGAFNVGANGTYYMHREAEFLVGAGISDQYHTTVGSANAQARGVPSSPYLIYRARLGWSNGPWSVTGFMDYQSHYYHSQSAPPNVNGNTCTSTVWGAPAGGTYPCAQNGYTNLTPAWTSFDLNIGYDTGFEPTNEYLRNIGIQLVVQNILDKHTDYLYKPTAAGGPPCTCNPLRVDFGRQVSIILTKTW